MWDAIFVGTNGIAVIGWLILLVAPRNPLAHSTILFACVGLLCAAYLAMFVGLFGGLVDPVVLPGSSPPSLADYSVKGLHAFFQSDGGIVLGWTHYLSFDLFVGLWIGRDADAKGFSRLVQVPFLLATFLAGPIGLFGWLIMRERRARASGRG